MKSQQLQVEQSFPEIQQQTLQREISHPAQILHTC